MIGYAVRNVSLKIALVFFCILTFCIDHFAQINSDAEWICLHHIKTAYIADRYFPGGWTLKYDQRGRLIESIQTSWYLYTKSGRRLQHIYDTLGRPVLFKWGIISDSTNMVECELQFPIGESKFYYPSDSVVVHINIEWDSSGELVETHNSHTTTRWKKVKTPQGRRPVYWPDSLIELRCSVDTACIYTRPNPDGPITKSITTSYYTLKYSIFQNQLVKQSEYSVHKNDTVTTTRNFEWRTLHYRKDTIRYKTEVEIKLDREDERILESRSYRYKELTRTRKLFGFYLIRVNSTWHDDMFVCRHPWNHDYIALEKENTYNHEHACDRNTLKIFEGNTSAPPVYTYWP